MANSSHINVPHRVVAFVVDVVLIKFVLSIEDLLIISAILILKHVIVICIP